MRTVTDSCSVCGEIIVAGECATPVRAEVIHFFGYPNDGSGQPRTAMFPISRDMPQALHGIRVLLLEDDADAREVMQSFMEYQGADVVPAANAASALAVLATMKPHVIVTDINMPEHDGIWFVHQARELGHLDGVPTMAVTALQLERGTLEDAGFSAYLRKPVELDVLCSTVLALARRRKPSPGFGAESDAG
jgi:CheY-like chemotaxis protein